MRNTRGKTEDIDIHKVILNYIKRKGKDLPPVFDNTGIWENET